ncbi:MAG: integrin alpha, partial [Pseudonocardiaceae bacterium]
IGDMDGGGLPDIVIGANRFTEIGATAQPGSHCAMQTNPNGICHDAGRAYIYRGEEIAGTNPAVILDGTGPGQTPPKTLRNPGAQSDENDITFTRSEIFGHAQFPIGDVGVCRVGGTGNFPPVSPGERCGTLARTNVPDGKPEIVISAHRADAPIFNPDPSRYEEGFSFLVDGATGAILHIYHHPEPQPNALFGYTTRQSFPVGDLGGTTLPDLVQGAFQNAQKAQAGRLYALNGDFNATFPVLQTLNNPTPTTNERFGIAREGVGDLVPGNTGPELLVGVFPSNANLPDAITDMHFVNAQSGETLQTITDPDNQLSSNFGYQVTPLGDLNEDGFLDFATAAPNWDSPGVGGAAGLRDQGRIYIFRSDNSPAATGATPGPAAAPPAPTTGTPSQNTL